MRENQDRLVWFRGDVVPLSSATVSVLSGTAQFGLNVFEGIRGYWSEEQSELFLVDLPRHLRRLRASATVLGLSVDASDDEILEAIRSTIRAGDFQQDISARVMFLVDSLSSWSEPGHSELVVAPMPAQRVRPTDECALKATVSSWRRISDDSMPPRVKTGANYVSGRYAMRDAQYAGFDLPILLTASGKVSEAPGSSVVLLRENALIFPTLTSGILEGITRDTVAGLAADMGLTCLTRDVDRTELLLADEVFVCGSAAEIRAIGSVDRVPIGAGGFGPVTSALLETYHRAVDGRSRCDHVDLSSTYRDE